MWFRCNFPRPAKDGKLHDQNFMQNSSLLVRQLHSTRSSSTADGPRNAMCQSNFANCCKQCRDKLQDKSRRNRNNGVRGSQSTNVCTVCVRPRRARPHRCNTQVRPSTSFVDHTNRLAMAKFSKSRVCGKFSEGSTLIFQVTRISLYNSLGQVKGSSHVKTSSICVVVSIHYYRLVTDRLTDGQTHDNSIYRDSIVSRCRNRLCYNNKNCTFCFACPFLSNCVSHSHLINFQTMTRLLGAYQLSNLNKRKSMASGLSSQLSKCTLICR